ncbi:zinc-binding dehydrogenase [Agromyces sp. NPDC058104]|uniref:zinc-dependent alcohol dehydrogenase n=1 Tax=Agromyces sp. NPDC058104 TaxID=3346342 RepID=UPI0036DA0AB1
MRSARYLRDGRFEVRDDTTTAPAPGDVRIRVSYVGICGTDLHIKHGAMDARVPDEAIIGHEMSGTIESIGEGVEGWTVGQSVTVMPLDWDGTCPACLAGNTHICQNLSFVGVDSAGALQELWNVPAELLVALPDGMSLRDAALVEPVAVAVHDVRRSGLAAGDRAVVIGGGPIGVLIATAARRFGGDVVLLEVDPGRRAAAETLGLAALDPRDTATTTHLDEWTGGAGADVVFEVSGAAAAVLGATGYAKVRGTLVIVAIHPEPRPIDLHRVFWRELTILGARVYQRPDYETAINLIADGDIPVDELVSHVVPLDRIGEAFDALESGGAMKVLVAVDEAGAAA